MRLTARLATLLAAGALIAPLAACAPPTAEAGATSTASDGTAWGTTTSAEAGGGRDSLVAAAKAEGELNVIALPPDWANYGAIIDAFEQEYGITVNSDQPDAASQDEIDTAKRLAGQDGAPDVFDLGQSVTLANTDQFASYQVATWDDVPAANKEETGLWVNDYGGYMSIGYDSAKVPAPSTVADLLKPEYKGAVALNGDPTQAGAAFSGVVMAALGSGGSADDLTPGVSFFSQLNDAGNFLPVDPTAATITSGQTPVVIDWDYLNAAITKDLPTWKVVVPTGAVTSQYYNQAINKDAPHPAAARLWQEFLYSDEGQNLWLAGGARPIRADAMVTAGTIDQTEYAKLPAVSGTPVALTAEQTAAGAQQLASTWAAAVS
ncbi:ABC transporter substrate-binding protein [Quadrisphaera sp. INWT6]|uniref:ABC transporter substrate-binding protein n=1 Tax=Quadrisphaera sp. INWT6 TaxID=2596917 RepID=UPI001891F841|nr:ABC transporter substrate-binding protein [Quadrisphaera sp. INWT6]MBF5083090.1 ABC transporter substrate-binding protein [Quadrisphaera sp. INWT6]